MLRTVYFLFFIQLNSLFAGIQNHLKPCLDKGQGHAFRNVDFIYMINLDHRPEKFDGCTAQLHPYGIYPYRFSAIYAANMPAEVFDDVGVKYEAWMEPNIMGVTYNEGKSHQEMVNVPGKSYFCPMLSSPIAIALSHISILQDAWDAKYNTIWVMEDDIQVIRDPRQISDLIDKLDSLVGADEWDVLFTDQDTKDGHGRYVRPGGIAYRPNYVLNDIKKLAIRKNISSDLRKVGARFGAYSMIIRRSGIEKLLNYFKTYHIFLPYDVDYYLVPNIKFYTVTHDVVSTQPNAPSDNISTGVMGPQCKPFCNDKELEMDILRTKQLSFEKMAQLSIENSEKWTSFLIDTISLNKPERIAIVGKVGKEVLIPIAYANEKLGYGKIFVENALSLSNMEDIAMFNSYSNQTPATIDFLYIHGHESPHLTFSDLIKWSAHVKEGGICIYEENTGTLQPAILQWLDQNYLKLGEMSEGACMWSVWIKSKPKQSS